MVRGGCRAISRGRSDALLALLCAAKYIAIPDNSGRTMTDTTAYRFGLGVALAAALILVWLSLGVGIIGRDGDPANLMYFGVLAVGLAGTLIARFRPRGMARALFATALAQTLVAAIALVAGLGYPWSGALELVALNGFFVALFVGSAWLFLRAARGRPQPGAV